MKVHAKLWAVGCLASMVIVMGGCGGSDSETTSESPPLTKAAFVKKAQAICVATREKYLEDGLAELAKESPKTDKERSALEVKIVATMQVPRLEEEMERVRALKPPTKDEAQVEEILSAVEGVIAETKANPKLFIERQTTFKHPYHDARILASKYGIAACAQA